MVSHLMRAETAPDDGFRAGKCHIGAPRREIWWVNLDPARGSEIRKTRPAIVVTANALNRARRTVVVVPLSTGPQPRPPIIVSTPSAGPNSVAVCDQVRAVDKRRLTRSEGQLSAVDLRSIEDSLRRVLEL
jgi:mRNA interferase MazF